MVRKDPIPEKRTFFTYRAGDVSFNGEKSRADLFPKSDEKSVFINAELRHGMPVIRISLSYGNSRRWFEILLERCMGPDMIFSSDFLYDENGDLASDLKTWNDVMSRKMPLRVPETPIDGKPLAARVFESRGGYSSYYLHQGSWKYCSMMIDGLPGEIEWEGDDRELFTEDQKITMDKLATCGGNIDILVILEQGVGSLNGQDFLDSCNKIKARNRQTEKDMLDPTIIEGEPPEVRKARLDLLDRNQQWALLAPGKRPAQQDMFSFGREGDRLWQTKMEVVRTGRVMKPTNGKTPETQFATTMKKAADQQNGWMFRR